MNKYTLAPELIRDVSLDSGAARTIGSLQRLQQYCTGLEDLRNNLRFEAPGGLLLGKPVKVGHIDLGLRLTAGYNEKRFRLSKTKIFLMDNPSFEMLIARGRGGNTASLFPPRTFGSQAPGGQTYPQTVRDS